MLERAARGWLPLARGFPAGTDALAATAYHDARTRHAVCSACGHVGLTWQARQDSGHVRIFDECSHCRHSVEVMGS